MTDHRRWVIWSLASSMLVLGCLWSASERSLYARTQPPWAKAKRVSSGEAKSIGFYSEGCIQGAQALKAKAPGLRSVRRGRGRFYGHPNLLSTLYQIGEELNAEGLKPALIGDLSQPRGGLMSFGHKSHQMGLDADVWFGETLKGKSAVIGREERLNMEVWSQRHEALLQVASEQDEVERIFVHWRIKEHFCAQPTPPAWSRKLRPWFGHDKHFHIRLFCPKDSLECEPQASLPEGLGCDPAHLTWFSAKEVRARRKAEAKQKQAPLTQEERLAKRAARRAREERSELRRRRCAHLSPRR